MRDSKLERNAVNSFERCDISAMPMPVPLKLRRPFAASSRTDTGRAEGPGPKLITREVMTAVSRIVWNPGTFRMTPMSSQIVRRVIFEDTEIHRVQVDRLIA